MGLTFSIYEPILVCPLRIKLKEFAFYSAECCTFMAKYRPGTMCIQGTIISFLSLNLNLVIAYGKSQNIHY